jgi:hypothetical protein
MKILRAVGLGITIIMLQFLVPRLFAGFENTLLAFFDTLQSTLGLAKHGMQALSSFPAENLRGQAGTLFPLIRE